MNDKKNKNDGALETGYEHSEVNIARIVLVGIVFVVLLIISLVILNEYFIVTKERDIRNIVLAPQSAALRELRAREDEALNSYRVIDSQNGIYQIPIRRAMELVAENAFRNELKPDGNIK